MILYNKGVKVMPEKMNRREFLKVAAATGAAMTTGGAILSFAQEAKTIQLPPPQMEGGKPLMQALKERRSSSEFSSERLSLPILSNLLWAAFGVNRPDGRRTAPTASNRQEIDIYAAMADGLYQYDAKAQALNLVHKEDIRAMTGSQAYLKEAPLVLVYVADFSRMGTAKDEDKLFAAVAASGLISQNVYLYCASEGLAARVRSSIDRAKLAPAMNLRPDQRITLDQAVGYPKK
jgi:nitroreductase